VAQLAESQPRAQGRGECQQRQKNEGEECRHGKEGGGNVPECKL
jgi:hypothetical protein